MKSITFPHWHRKFLLRKKILLFFSECRVNNILTFPTWPVLVCLSLMFYEITVDAQVWSSKQYAFQPGAGEWYSGTFCDGGWRCRLRVYWSTGWWTGGNVCSWFGGISNFATCYNLFKLQTSLAVLLFVILILYMEQKPALWISDPSCMHVWLFFGNGITILVQNQY